MTRGSENRHTCFQRRRDSPNLPPSLRRKMSKPASMIRSKTMLETIVGIKLSTLDCMLTMPQVFCAGNQTERSYGQDEPSGSKVIKISHLPGRHLFTKPSLNEIPDCLQR